MELRWEGFQLKPGQRQGRWRCPDVLHLNSHVPIANVSDHLTHAMATMTVGIGRMKIIVQVNSMHDERVYIRVQNVWCGSKSVVMFGLIKILTHLC